MLPRYEAHLRFRNNGDRPMAMIGELFSGKTLARSQQNHALKRWRHEMVGTVVDLASGAPMYRDFWSPTADVNWVRVDIRPSTHPSLIADVTKDLPIGDDRADVVVSTGFLHITSNPGEFLREVRRIIRSGGVVVLTTSLVFHYHPTPTDYWRFTREGLTFLLDKAGFETREIVEIGGRWASAAHLLAPYMRPRRVVRPLVFLVCSWLDAFATRFLKRWIRPSPSGFCVLATAR